MSKKWVKVHAFRWEIVEARKITHFKKKWESRRIKRRMAFSLQCWVHWLPVNRHKKASCRKITSKLLLVVGSQAIVWSTPSQVWKLELWIAWRLMLLITDFFSRLAVSMPAHMGDTPFQALSMLRLKFKSRCLLFEFKILQEQLKIRVSSNVSWWLSVKNFFPMSFIQIY